ncbi:hypothetical protein MTO96_010951 [Rhipicephalus appendiculatus]
MTDLAGAAASAACSATGVAKKKSAGSDCQLTRTIHRDCQNGRRAPLIARPPHPPSSAHHVRRGSFPTRRKPRARRSSPASSVTPCPQSVVPHAHTQKNSTLLVHRVPRSKLSPVDYNS